MKKALITTLILTFFFFGGCSIMDNRAQAVQGQQTAIATAPAALLERTTATVESTISPQTAALDEGGMGWTPSPGEILSSDAGKDFSIRITSRISLILREEEYPVADLELQCTPVDTLGRISNVPVVPAGYYVFRYEGLRAGVCTVQNGQFVITIKVID